MIDDTLQYDSIGPITGSSKWATGTGSGLAFQSIGGRIVIGMTSGTDIAVRSSVPENIHQSIEARITYDTMGASSTYSGVVGRFVDASNYVLLRARHDGSRIFDVIERVAGVDYVLATSSVPNAFPRCALRLEIIGNRARVWFELQQDDVYAVAQGVADRPPDAGYTLRASTETGKWGIYCSSGGSNTAYFTRFTAKQLPSLAPQPPMATFSSSPSLKLTPITVTFSGFAGDGKYETQVTPSDPLDFPEQYIDAVAASYSSHVIWVRPGYAYNVRARDLVSGGAGQPWTPVVQINTGSRSALSSPTLLPNTFPDVLPDFVFEQTSTGMSDRSQSNTGHYRMSGAQLGTRRSFKLTFANRPSSDYQQVIDFFDEVHGNLVSFNWTIPDSGTVMACRFDSEELEITYNDESEEVSSPIAAISVSLTEVDPSANLNLTITLNLDSSFY